MAPERQRWLELCERDPELLTDEELEFLNTPPLTDKLEVLLEEFMLDPIERAIDPNQKLPPN